MLRRASRPKEIHVTAFEIDGFLIKHLKTALSCCRQACEAAGVAFAAEVHQEDFIRSCAEGFSGQLFEAAPRRYDCAIMNPPYRKIRSNSDTRRHLRHLGIETSNLYTAFMAVAVQQLRPGGELVSISPRSFCNGPYFRSFRRFFLGRMVLRRVHVFESRTRAFEEDGVLQENVIVHAVRMRKRPERVAISTSTGPDGAFRTRRVRYDQVVNPRDPNLFIHLVVDDQGEHAADRMSRLPASLDDLGVGVSTGRVVDFRVRSDLRKEAGPDTAPLIYPAHFDNGAVKWPNPTTRKPNAILIDRHTEDLLVPPGTYVLTKRFSAKEERRRVVAAVYDSDRISDSRVGFENHLNYFHSNGGGLPRKLAVGLCLFLNSTLADTYFRQFSGHTQVNAADLRSLRYPDIEQLMLLAENAPDDLTDQREVDEVVERILFGRGSI